MFAMELGTVVIALVPTLYTWVFAFAGADGSPRDCMKKYAGMLPFFFVLPDLIRLMVVRIETNGGAWRLAPIVLAPLLPAWIAFLHIVVAIDVSLKVMCFFGFSWEARKMTMILWLILGVVGSPIWGWMSIVSCAIAGLAFTLACSLVAWPTMYLSEHIERRALRCS